ncbi:MAG TPA: TRAP transporter small permease [Geminicoccus sp.]|jgi:TRAP-type C4-dicarboxylate transport system permease small subunit|uniref:TRAP transporter small permease n=1 Tax=Geminicoccus sp. TaxID=2024832 RepID=UPI002E313FCD|nr:TRAP transporter small permease [Geminicoccus sp.]HEX2527822.1 TRAP transporter small permease [Geminicoccus sp.]
MYERVRDATDRLCRAIEILCNLILAVMTAVIAVLIISRNLVGFSFSWSEELTRFLLVWLSMLGAAVLLGRDDHISLNLLQDRLGPKAQLVISFLLRLLVLAFLVILAQQSWTAALARQVTHAPALGISLFWPYLAIPVAAVLMILVTLVSLWGETLQLLGRRPLHNPGAV